MKNFILKFIRRNIYLLPLIAFLTCNEYVNASHGAGGEMTYSYIGNNQYVVTFTFYRDCAGISPSPSYTLNVNSTICGVDTNYIMYEVGIPIQILPTCSGTLTTCNGGTNPGIEQYHYEDTITLSQQCPDWNFNTFVSPRNSATTTIQNPGSQNLYVDANLNNLSGPNSSPVFSVPAIAYECIGQTDLYTQNAYDVDGDSLVYSFIAPRQDVNTPLAYLPGYSITNPIVSSPPISISATTGDITMNPTQPDVSIIAIQVLEYRNGIIIGSIMRDMQIYLVHCSNIVPDLNPHIFSIITVCAGSQLCFDIYSHDPDTSQILTMTWNNSIPAATFTVSGSPFPIGHFCWTPTITDVRNQPYTFTVSVRDDACPSNGIYSTTYSIIVKSSITAINVTPSVQCHGSHNGSATAITTSNNLLYTWQFPNGTSIITSNPTISHLSPGNYTLNVADTNGCNIVDYFTISEPPPLNILSSTVVNAGCSSAFGSANITVTGGTPGYYFHWSNGDTLPSINNLVAGQYNLTISDSHHCTISTSTNILNVTPANYTFSIQDATCQGDDGSAIVNQTGGVGPFSYRWSPDVAGDTIHSAIYGLLPRTYSVTVSDWNTGCTQSYSGIVHNTNGITAAISVLQNATCKYGNDGSAIINATGGNAPYTYLWSNGDVTQTTHHLQSGIQSVDVMDHSGCHAFAFTNIGFNNPPPYVNLGPDTMPCIGHPIVIFPPTGNGIVSYVWNPSGISGQPLIVNSNGTYSVTVTNSAGCTNSDTINVNFVTCFTHHHSEFDKTSPIINIYPNPTDENVNVYISKLKDTEITFRLSDILGNNLFFDKQRSENDVLKIIDMHLFPAGIYMLRIEFNDEIKTYRVVKE